MHQAEKLFRDCIDQTVLAEKLTDNLIQEINKSEGVRQLSESDRSFLSERYFPSLLKLKLAYWKTADKAYAKIYLDERLRYAPHRLPPIKRKAFFESLLINETAIFQSLGANKLIIEQFLSLNQSLIKEIAEKTITLLAIGDCLLNEVRAFLPDLEDGTATDVRCIYFSANQATGLDMEEILSFLNEYSIDLIAMSFLTYEALPGYSRLVQNADKMARNELDAASERFVATIRESINTLRAKTEKTILLHGVSGLPLHRFRKYLSFLKPLSKNQKYVVNYIDAKIMELADSIENCIFIDERSLAESSGYRNVSREIAPQKTFGGMFHTTRFGQKLAEQLYLPIVSAFGWLSQCKVLLVDFDNTLWSGVMADGDVHHYFERQRLLRSLKDVGIVLVALSKNSPENIRWAEMELKENDFAALKIGWNTKAQSLKEISKMLNLNTENFVLLDDSRQERSLMAAVAPEVVCLDACDNSTWRALEFLFDFPNTKETREAKLRTEMYQQQVKREGAMNAVVDYPTMMRSLGLWYRMGQCTEKHIDRVVELINRTNQFNTTTIRYSKQKVKEFLSDAKTHLLYSELGDKFGSLGIVAVLILVEQENSSREAELVIDSFIMSCRAMGFNLEHQILSQAEDKANELGKHRIIGRYIPTERNSPCSGIFEKTGFTLSGSGDWVLEINDRKKIPDVEWIETKGYELDGN